MKKLFVSAITAAALFMPSAAMAMSEARSSVLATFAVLACTVQNGTMTTDEAGEFAMEYFMENDVPLAYASDVMNEPGFNNEVRRLVRSAGGCSEILK